MFKERFRSTFLLFRFRKNIFPLCDFRQPAGDAHDAVIASAAASIGHHNHDQFAFRLHIQVADDAFVRSLMTVHPAAFKERILSDGEEKLISRIYF